MDNTQFEDKVAQVELSQSLSKPRNSDALRSYNISITIKNKSSVGFQKAEVAVKDNESGDVETAYFGHIPSGGSAQQIVQMPGGIEFCIWKILPDVGEEIYGSGIANNAPGVVLTIND